MIRIGEIVGVNVALGEVGVGVSVGVEVEEGEGEGLGGDGVEGNGVGERDGVWYVGSGVPYPMGV